MICEVPAHACKVDVALSAEGNKFGRRTNSRSHQQHGAAVCASSEDNAISANYLVG
jgi:hypothetical protein